MTTRRDLLETLPEALLRLTAEDGRVLEANTAACRLLGHAQDALQRFRIQDLDDTPDADAYWRSRLADASERATRETSLRTRDGGLLPVEIRSTAANAEDAPPSLWLSIRDTAQRRLREALRYAHVGYWSLDAQTLSAEWSEEIYRILAIDPETPPGPATLRLRLHPEDLDRVMRSLQQSLEQGREHDIDYPILRPDGEVRWINCRAKPVRDAWGRIARVEGFVQDITERQRSTERLATREQVLGSIFRTLPIGIGLLRERVFQEVNDGFCTMTGYAREELLGRSARLIYPDDAEFERVGREKYALIRTTGHGEIETRLRRKDGRVIEVLLGSTLVDRDDPSAGTTFTATDISARKEAERQALESETLFTQAFHAAGTILAISSFPEGIYEHVNDAFIEIFGYARDEAIGTRSVDLGILSDTQHQQLLEAIGSAGHFRNIEQRFTREDGRVLDCLYNGEVIEIRGRKKLLSIVHDITPLKDSQRALRASEERFALAMRGSNDGVFDWDIRTDEVYYSSRWKSMLGYRDEELENRLETWERLVNPADREPSLSMLRDYIDGRREDFGMEFRMRHRDGHWVDILSRAYLARDEAGMPVRVVGTHVDITERKQAQRQIEAERARAERYLEVAGSMLLALDDQGCVTLINPKGREVIGLTESEILGRSWIDHFIPQQDREEVRSIFARILRGELQAVEYVEAPLLNAHGQQRLIAWHNSVLRDASGRIIGTLSSGNDVTERNAAELALRDERRFLQHVIDGIEDPILVVHRSHQVLRMNQAARLKAAETGEVPQRVRCHELRYRSDEPCDSGDRACPMHQVLKTGRASKVLHQVADAGGLERTFEVSASPLRTDDGQLRGVIEISRDITDHLELLEALRLKELRYARLAQYDRLTELPNRFLFADRLNQAVEMAHRTRSKLAVLLLDVDQFKQVNDSFDHSDGDAVLVALARRLEGLFRGADTIARMGGDEFSIILNNVGHDEDAAKVARTLLALFKEPFEIRGHRLFLGASIGISLYPEHGARADDLVRNADAALFRAKAEGRNSFQYYSRDLTAKAFERILLESSLHDAITNQELVLHYQPQLDLSSGAVCGVEALVRWLHPSMGLVPPDRFIPLAESTGLIVAMGDWVLREACAQMTRWRAAGLLPSDALIGVNLSAKQLAQEDLIAKVRQALETTGLPATSLELEITESSVMISPEESATRLGRLRALGVKLAMDDFGTGYSSLSYLKRLPLTKLKIDRSFVSDIPEDANDTAIAKAIIALGKSLALDILAEGIETQGQREFLVEEGCDRGQGYLFSKPLPASDLEVFLARATGHPAHEHALDQ